MAVEIEAKMKLDNRAQLISRLQEIGSKPIAQIEELNTYFDTPNGDLKAADEGLRIRTEKFSDGQVKTILTHKGPRAHGRLKSRTENEAEVTNAAHTTDLLKALGYTPVLTFEKKRERWEVDGCRVEIDQLPHLGDYIEIEGPNDDVVMSVRKKLNLGDQPLLKASYIAMLSTYLQEKHSVNIKEILFNETK